MHDAQCVRGTYLSRGSVGGEGFHVSRQVGELSVLMGDAHFPLFCFTAYKNRSNAILSGDGRESRSK